MLGGFARDSTLLTLLSCKVNSKRLRHSFEAVPASTRESYHATRVLAKVHCTYRFTKRDRLNSTVKLTLAYNARAFTNEQENYEARRCSHHYSHMLQPASHRLAWPRPSSAVND